MKMKEKKHKAICWLRIRKKVIPLNKKVKDILILFRIYDYYDNFKMF